MAATGFLVSHKCALTSAQAATLLQADYPQINNGFFINAPTVTFTAPNTFGVTLKTTMVNNTTTVTAVKTIVVPMCDPNVEIDPGITPFDPLVAAAFWSFSMTFIFGVWLLSKNASAILNFVRRG